MAACLADRVLQHVEDPLRVLGEVRRVLRSGARVAIFEPDWGSLTVDADDQEAVSVLARELAPSAPQRRIGLQLRRLLVETGFEDIDCAVEPAWARSVEHLGRLISIEPTLERIVRTGLLPEGRAEAFRAQLERRSERGAFFATLNRMMISAAAP